MSLSCTAIEPLRFRKALGHYASGITVITSHIDDEPIGFTCQSFYSVSMSPPLVSFSVMSSSASYPKIRQAGRFAVNILSGDQVRISNQFARRGEDKWHGIEWQASPLAAAKGRSAAAPRLIAARSARGVARSMFSAPRRTTSPPKIRVGMSDATAVFSTGSAGVTFQARHMATETMAPVADSRAYPRNLAKI